jgi:hypothetical protein
MSEGAAAVKFESVDGDFAMTARGETSTGSPAEVLEAHWKHANSQPGRYVEYQKKAGSWFVVSGIDRKGVEFYQKFMVRGNQTATFTLTYPHSRVHEYDAWVATIESHFAIASDPSRKATESTPVTTGTRRSDSTPSPRREGDSFSQDRPLGRSFDLEAPAEIEVTRTMSPRTSRSSVDLSPPREVAKKQEAPADESNTRTKPVLPEKTPLETRPPPSPEKPVIEDLPYGVPVAGKPGFAYSPYEKDKMVDVVDIQRGTKVRCPYTKKVFRVP